MGCGLRVSAARGSDRGLELLMSKVLCRRKYYMSDSQKGEAEAQRSAPLQNHTGLQQDCNSPAYLSRCTYRKHVSALEFDMGGDRTIYLSGKWMLNQSGGSEVDCSVSSEAVLIFRQLGRSLNHVCS
ncbi:uncharacterized protein FN964_010883 isoform 3-T4 [Alca torda]